jgi:single-strand DNA-binding protein
MNHLNSIILEGNVKDVRLATAGATDTCTFTIAVGRIFKDADGKQVEEESLFDVQSFGVLAEQCRKHCTVGRGVRIVGRLKQERWTSEGKVYSRVVVIAEHVEYKPVTKEA